MKSFLGNFYRHLATLYWSCYTVVTVFCNLKTEQTNDLDYSWSMSYKISAYPNRGLKKALPNSISSRVSCITVELGMRLGTSGAMRHFHMRFQGRLCVSAGRFARAIE